MHVIHPPPPRLRRCMSFGSLLKTPNPILPRNASALSSHDPLLCSRSRSRLAGETVVHIIFVCGQNQDVDRPSPAQVRRRRRRGRGRGGGGRRGSFRRRRGGGRRQRSPRSGAGLLAKVRQGARELNIDMEPGNGCAAGVLSPWVSWVLCMYACMYVSSHAVSRRHTYVAPPPSGACITYISLNCCVCSPCGLWP